MGIFSRLGEWLHGETTMSEAGRGLSGSSEYSRVRAVRMRSGTQALRVVYRESLKANLDLTGWPQEFVDYATDMLIAAKENSKDRFLAFDRVLRDCKDDADRLDPPGSAIFLSALAEALPGVQFSRTDRGPVPENDWYVLTCTAEDLAQDLPQVRAVKEVHAEKGLPHFDRDDAVSLFDVFSGLKTAREE